MKEHHYKKKFESSVLKLLDGFPNVDDLVSSLAREYRSFTNQLPLACSFKIELIETESIRYSVYYQDSVDMSKKTIMISHRGYDAYLWTDCDGWCLDDDLYKNHEIAASLSVAPLFCKVPENIRELKSLIDDGYWGFKPDQMPTFHKDKPKDTREVLSWDEKFVLAGTSMENMEMVSRGEWDGLCDREQNWFK